MQSDIHPCHCHQYTNQESIKENQDFLILLNRRYIYIEVSCKLEKSLNLWILFHEWQYMSL